MRASRMLSLLYFLPLLARSEETRTTGAYVRLNQKGVDYFASVASAALPHLLENFTMPTVAADMATIKPVVLEFGETSISAKFLASNGVQARVTVESVLINASTHVHIPVFVDEKEPVLIRINKIDIDLTLHFARSENRNVITAERCEVVEPVVNFTFITKSSLKDFESTFLEKITSGLRDAVCVTAVQALNYVDEQHVQQETQAETPAEYVPGSHSAAEFAEDLCADENAQAAAATPPPPPPGSPIQSGPPFSLDLTMTSPARFTDKDVTFGVKGGVLLASLSAADVPQPPPLNASLLGGKMIGVMLTDYVPNTLLSHVFDYGLGEIDYKVRPEHLPSSLKTIAKMLCGGCSLQVHSSLIKKPRIEIDDKLGARVHLAANVSILFHGKAASYDVINATTEMLLTLKPTVRQSRLYGDVALTSVDFDIKNLGMTGALAVPLEKFMAFVVPRTMWPVIRKRIRFALHQRGIRLPILCGVFLQDLTLFYTERAVVVHSDLTFDLPLFLRKFKAYSARKAAEAAEHARIVKEKAEKEEREKEEREERERKEKDERTNKRFDTAKKA